jgi:hypothetical protein
MESINLEKQNYITREITSKGYNTDSFYSFLLTQKEDGSNLSLWTYEELVSQVQSFQSSYEPEEPQEQKDQNTFSFNPMTNLPSSRSENSYLKQNTYAYQTVDTQFNTIKGEIECLRPEKTELLSENNITILLSFPEKVKQGRTTFFTFLVETQPKGYSVRRKEKDFIWLRETLRKQYPGVFIPPIKNKELPDSSSEEKITKRMKSCNYFLNEIKNNALLLSSKVFYDFLKTETHDEFKLKKKAYDKEKAPQSLKDMISLDGIIELDGEILDKGNNTTFEKSKQFAKESSVIIHKLNKSLKKLTNDIRTVGNGMREIEGYFNNLTELIKGCPDYNNKYQFMQSSATLFSHWGYNQLKQAMNVELELKEHFKFVYKEYVTLCEMYNEFEKNKNEYLKSKDKLIKKKEDLFKKKDVKRWQLRADDTRIDFENKTLCFEKMLPKETENLEDMKKYACYFGVKFEEEFKRIIESLELSHKQFVENVYQKQVAITKEACNIWDTYYLYNEENDNNNDNDNNNNNELRMSSQMIVEREE